MPKIRVRASKQWSGRHHNGYSQGRRLEKERNHTHKLFKQSKLNGQMIELCSIPRCDLRRILGDE